MSAIEPPPHKLDYAGPRRDAAASPAPSPPRAASSHFVLSNITKNFPGSSTPAIVGIDLECRLGEFVVVVGPSGSGKSTLLNVAGGMIRADSGSVTLDGKAVDGPGPERAMVFQDHGLFAWLSAEQNVEFGLKMAGVPKAERRDRVAAALKMVHLTRSAKKL